MARVLSLIMAAALASAFSISARAAEPLGMWLVQDRTAKVRIAACGHALCGVVAWLSEPNDKDTGKPQLDKLNADPNMRGRPIMGVPILMSMEREAGKWAGRIYNPDDGNTYRGTLEILNPRQLMLRVCVAVVYCQTETWVKSD